jgi:hypothetical protein
MIAYVFGVVGIFRLTRGALSGSVAPDGIARTAAWIAAIIYAANPNLMYMQSTAMGEAMYLAFFVWTLAYLSEWLRGNPVALTRCGLCLAGAALTRYDGWFLTAVLVPLVLVRTLMNRNSPAKIETGSIEKRAGGTPGLAEFARRGKAGRPIGKGNSSQLIVEGGTQRNVVRFLLITAAAPTLWLAYNAIIYRNPLEFENGPYSAKAIELKTQKAGNPGHPGTGNLLVAGMYFLKAAEDNVAANEWLQRGWVLLTLAAILIPAILFRRQTWRPFTSSASPLLFLLLPVPFYALSVAYSGVPIFVPQWWPFSHYNVRYGLQLLPAFSVAVAILISFVLRNERWDWRLRFAGILALLAFVFASYSRIWRAGPVCLQEAEINMRTRNQLEIQLATWLEKLPPDSTLLMYLGDHVGAVQRAGIPLSHTINEGNHHVWKQPIDPDGLWERALADPGKYADFALAFEGDPVRNAVQDLHLHELVEVHVSGQARAALYRLR